MALPQRLKDAAKNIRTELKKHGIKNRVYCGENNGFECIDIDLLEDQLPATIKAINQYAKKFGFLYEMKVNPAYMSKEFRNDLQQYIQERYVTDSPGFYSSSQMAWRILNEREKCDFWASRKPKRRQIPDHYFSTSCYR